MELRAVREIQVAKGKVKKVSFWRNSFHDPGDKPGFLLASGK